MYSSAWDSAWKTDVKKSLETLPGLTVASWEESCAARPDSDDDSYRGTDSESEAEEEGEGEGGEGEGDEEDLYWQHHRSRRVCSLCPRR